ncbi:MAG TPA: aminopeptidase P N-terminal domain-containing protein [Gemmatimonadales bacterium]
MRKTPLLVVAALLLAGSPLTAQFTPGDFAARRDTLAARIGDGIVIADGGRTLVNDFSRFFQLPAFHYLTGYDEPDAAMVIVVHGGHQATTLFVTKLAARTAFYYGQRADTAMLAQTLGVTARSSVALTGVVDSLVATGVPVYSLADFEDADFARQDSLTRGQSFIKALVAGHPGLVIKNAHPIVNQMRAHKTSAEIAALRRAAVISSDGHRAVLLMPEPTHEYDMQAVLESTFLKEGGERPAYGSIVGAGANSTLLHYMLDRGPARPGDIVVIDAATQYDGYAADVTRSIPVSGKYTPEQRAIYQLVRNAQAAAERNARPGLPRAAAWDSATALRARGLAALGLIESVDATYDPPDAPAAGRGGAARASRQADFWMIHGISHGLGVAVHDYVQTGANGAQLFAEGDAFTIEPGIYISSKMLDVLPDTPRNRAFIAKVRPMVAKYDRTGVRIEDDYVITARGLERLSNAPRELGEIEAMMARRPAPKK